MRKKVRENKILIGLVFLTFLLILIFQKYGKKEYSKYSTDTLHYEKGKVVEVSLENVEYDSDLGIYLGKQVLQVEMLEGEEKGEKLEVVNYLTNTHSVRAKVDSVLIIDADRPEHMEAYYTVYNFDRTLPIMSCVGILILAIILIGEGKGVKAIAGLAYSMALIIYLILPAVFSGYSPIVLSILCAILSTAVTLLLLNGESRKTAAAILATVVGACCALVFFVIMSALLHINGTTSAEAEGLILIQQGTGLQVKDVLFAGVLISSLGAIMDVAMSIVSSLYEVARHNQELSARELFASGIEIGKDMIGTMTNTLILAFTGSAFVTLLVFISYQVQFNQLLSSNYLAIEIAQGVCGTFGIVLTVPAASLISAFYIKKKA